VGLETEGKGEGFWSRREDQWGYEGGEQERGEERE
jgi:hypothetical protein